MPEIEKALAELKRLMAYRVANAESDEQKSKELAYTGLGLTSRKNLCINPDVRMLLYPRSIQQLLNCSRWLKRRKGMSWTHAVGISRAWLQQRGREKIQAPCRFANGMKCVCSDGELARLT